MTTAVRQVATLEARIEMLTARIDEIRSHLDQAGRRPQAAESHIQVGGNTSGYVKFTLSKEMIPDSFNCTDRMKFSDWEFKMSNFLSAGDHEHAGDILERTTLEQEDVAEDKFDRIVVQRGWVGQAREHTRFAKYLRTVLRNRTDGTPHRLVRNGRHKDLSERLEKAAHGVCTSDKCDSPRVS